MMSTASSHSTAPRILCFGEALWDCLPAGRIPGGAPMNVALRLSGLGADVSFISRVGRDVLGEELVSHLATEGLDTRLIQIDESTATGLVNVDLSDPTEVRYDIVMPAAWDYIAGSPVSVDDTAKYDCVVFGSLAARCAGSRESLLALLETPALKVLDVNLRPPYSDRSVIESLFRAADWVKLNEQELEIIGGWHDLQGTVEARAEALASIYGLRAVCVTLGAAGALLWHEGKVWRNAGYVVTVVDTIGSGDSFLATWLYSMLSGLNPGEALARGCAMGALVAARQGANPKVSEQELAALIAAVPGAY